MLGTQAAPSPALRVLLIHVPGGRVFRKGENSPPGWASPADTYSGPLRVYPASAWPF